MGFGAEPRATVEQRAPKCGGEELSPVTSQAGRFSRPLDTFLPGGGSPPSDSRLVASFVLVAGKLTTPKPVKTTAAINNEIITAIPSCFAAYIVRSNNYRPTRTDVALIVQLSCWIEWREFPSPITAARRQASRCCLLLFIGPPHLIIVSQLKPRQYRNHHALPGWWLLAIPVLINPRTATPFESWYQSHADWRACDVAIHVDAACNLCIVSYVSSAKLVILRVTTASNPSSSYPCLSEHRPPFLSPSPRLPHVYSILFLHPKSIQPSRPSISLTDVCPLRYAFGTPSTFVPRTTRGPRRNRHASSNVSKE